MRGRFFINRPELIKEVGKKVGIGRAKVEPVLDAILETIIESVSSGDEVKLLGFGKFESKIREARVGRNPQTGENVDIPDRRFPKFTAGKDFKDSVAI